MTKILNVGTYPVDLDDGRVLATGETATVDADDPHNKILITQGTVLVVNEKPSKTQTNSREDNPS